MRLVHDASGRIVATATDDYTGPDPWIVAPEGFTFEHVPRFCVVAGALAQAVPQQISSAQGIAALIDAGLWSDVSSFVAGIEDPTERARAEVALNRAQYWSRSSPFLAAAAEALQLTSSQLDALFIAASEIYL